jgi:hypothetical protein
LAGGRATGRARERPREGGDDREEGEVLNPAAHARIVALSGRKIEASSAMTRAPL